MTIVAGNIKDIKGELAENRENGKALLIMLDEKKDMTQIRRKLSKVPYPLSKKLIDERG